MDAAYLLRALRTFVAQAESRPSPETAQAEETGAAAEEDSQLGWEDAGCLVWDVAALPDDAAFLLRHGLPAMLPPLLAATAASEHWRALEIGLGIAANLACHAGARAQLLQLGGMPELLLESLLWVDDSASLGEVCRCTAALLAAAEGQAAERWWDLLLREETLGRIVWIVENTLSSALLERALNLLSCLVEAAIAAETSGDASKARLVPLLVSLGLLPLLASALHGWLVKMHAERQEFEGGGGPGSVAGGAAAATAAADQQQAGAAGGGVGTSERDAAALEKEAVAGGAAALERDAEAGGAVAAEVSEAAVLETLRLLEALAADGAGEAALSASAPIKDALLRTLAESDQRGMQAQSASLLASLDGMGPQLLARPLAVAAVLGRLAAVVQHPPQKRRKADVGADMAGGGAADVAELASAEQQAEEVEAGWALCSMLARALGEAEQQQQQQPARQEQAEAAAASAGAGADVSKVLAELAAHVGVLSYDWGSSPRAAAIHTHQAYVLRRLESLLEPLLDGPAREALQAAAARCEAAVAQA